MAGAKNIDTIWAVGLSEAQRESLGELLGKKYLLANIPSDSVPSLKDYEQVQPCLALFSPDALRGVLALPEASVRHLELMPKVMVLDKGYSQADLELAIDSGMAEILRHPYTKKQVRAKIRRALEIEEVHYDVLRMSKEIIMEREILERKNDILNFLVGFLTSTSITMSIEEIVEITAEQLQALFPVRSMQAAIWDGKDTSGETKVYISAPAGHESFKIWTEALRKSVQEARPGQALNLRIAPVSLKGQQEKWLSALPSDGHVLTLPISMGDCQCGLLLVLTDVNRSLSRDQAMALNSALRHLALTINTLQHYKIMQKHAEFDGLTGVHNRRNFDARIKAEVERALRYGYQLSLIFSDLDHFKNINDTYGHSAGDAVLRETGAILLQAVRAADYVARYGGEEFVIILPHTDIKQAYMLAERIRRQVAALKFDTGSEEFRLTISHGVAELGALPLKSPEALIEEADKALYRAKHNGRNRTVSCAASQAVAAV